MEFGFSLAGRGPLAGVETILKLATKAESLRFSSLFVTDHVVLPASMARSTYPYSTTGQLPGGAAQDYLEPLVTMGGWAGVTSRIRLGTSVLVVPYRNPVLVAKMLATIDRLSGGRVILGAGVGWLREEFEALGAPPFEARGAVTDEYLRLMRAAWTTDPVTFEGRYYSVRAVHALPKPAQRRGVPIWIGGHTDAAVRRAATLGDAWHPIALRPPGLLFPDEYAKRAQELRAWAQQAGRGSKVDRAHRARADGGAPEEREAARQRAAALPGNGRRGRRRHPRLPGGRRHAPRVRSDGAGAESGPDEHGALRPRRQRQRRETRTESLRISNRPSPCSRTMMTHDEAVRLIEGPPAGLGELLARAA